MNQYTILYLVRHGETEANVTNTLQGQSDVRLNEKGIRQAQLVGKRLRDQHFDVILSSDLSRAAVTAAEIANFAAGVVVGKIGTAPIMKEELIAALNQGDKIS